jgi:hypothetical protein
MVRPPIIFLGPSLSQKEAQTIFPEAEYRSPAKKGDLLQLAADPQANMVGLVDGVFMQDYPPTPIEVYQLIKKKNSVIAGAASLGALRAVELAKFGMVGIGTIFRLYDSCKIIADDEVAVTFGPNHLLESEALVDIRYNVFRARKRGIISSLTGATLVKVAKKIYFPHRTYDHISEVAISKFPSFADEIKSFQKFVGENRRSLKKKDAIELVKYFKGLTERNVS